MKSDDKIRDEKLQFDINREPAKISAILFGKIDKNEYVTGEEILSSNQRKIIEEAKFAYSPLGKTFEKQTKTIEDQGIKQIETLKASKPEKAFKTLEPEENQQLESIEGLFPKNMRTNKIKNEIDEFRKWKEKNKRKDLKYKTNNYLYNFQQFETIRSFGDSI